MTSRAMHYDFKQKLNKIDSQQYRDLIVPEIDWKLNEAEEVLIKMIAMPREIQVPGFESTQRTIDDIRTIVVNQKPSEYLVPTVFGSNESNSYICELPSDYWLYARSRAFATKGASCVSQKMKVVPIQHDDEDDLSPFDRSSFEWRVTNARFNKDGLRLFTDGTFSIVKLGLDYIRKPRLIHNAQDYVGGTYQTLDGVVLTGSQDSELPEPLHREIVDLAVLITAGDLSLPDYQLKVNKLKLTK